MTLASANMLWASPFPMLAASATALVMILLAPRTTDAFLNFNASSVDFVSQGLLTANIEIALKSRPKAPVAVYFDAPRTRFSKCALLFNETNWSRPRKVTVLTEGFLTRLPGAQRREIPITFQGFSAECEPQFHNVTLELPTRRDPGVTGKCLVAGADPHVRPFGQSLWFTYSGVFGDVYLVDSPALTVQARQSRCGIRSTCIHALAIRYGKSLLIIDGSRPERLIQSLSHSIIGLTIAKTRSGTTTTLNFAFRCGSNLRADILNAGPFTYMNVYLTMPQTIPGPISGVCGRLGVAGDGLISGKGGNVFALEPASSASRPPPLNAVGPPESVSRAVSEFVESWRVPEQNSIFKNNSAAVVYRPNASLVVRTTTCLRPSSEVFACNSTRPRRSVAVDSDIGADDHLSLLETGSELDHQLEPRQLLFLSRWSSKNVFQPAYTLLPIPFGFASISSVSRFDGKEPATPSWDYRRRRALTAVLSAPAPVPPTTRLPAPRLAALSAALHQCTSRFSVIPSCSENIDEYISHCLSNVRQGTHPNTAVELHKIAYTYVCAQQLLSQAMEPDGKVAQCAQSVVRALGFGASGCRHDPRCLQCTEMGCIQCKEPEKYEVKVGQCVPMKRPKAGEVGGTIGNGIEQAEWSNQDGAVDEYGETLVFAPAPAMHLLSKSEVVKSNSGEDARTELARHNPAINPSAIKTVEVS